MSVPCHTKTLSLLAALVIAAMAVFPRPASAESFPGQFYCGEGRADVGRATGTANK